MADGRRKALDEVVVIVSHAGMTEKQIADAVGASVATVEPDRDVARSWLTTRLES